MGITALTLAVNVFGAIIQAVCGFGYGPFSMSILPYLLPYHTAVASTNLCGCSVAFLIAVTNLRHINAKMFMSCSLVAVITAPLTIYFSVGAARGVLMRSLGAVLILIALYQMYFSGKLRIKPTFVNGMIAGFISGVLSGLFSMGAPPAAVYMLAASENKEEFRATLNAQFALIAIVSSVARYMRGLIDAEIVTIWLIALPALALGYTIGSRIFKKLNSKQVGIAINVYLVLAGLRMLLL